MGFKLIDELKLDDIYEELLKLSDVQRAHTDIIPYGKGKFMIYVKKDREEVVEKPGLTKEDFEAILNKPKAGQSGPSFTFGRLMTGSGGINSL